MRFTCQVDVSPGGYRVRAISGLSEYEVCGFSGEVAIVTTHEEVGVLLLNRLAADVAAFVPESPPPADLTKRVTQ